MNIRDWKDTLWILVASTIILLWGSIPTWTGHRAETSTQSFRGLYFDNQDYAVHIAMMEAGAHGEWAYQFKFTTEPHNSAHIRMFYIILGHVSGWLGLASELTFELPDGSWVFSHSLLYTI